MNNRMELFKHLYPKHLHDDPMAWHNFKFYVYPVCNEMLEALIAGYEHACLRNGGKQEADNWEPYMAMRIIIEKVTNKTWDTIKEERK